MSDTEKNFGTAAGNATTSERRTVIRLLKLVRGEILVAADNAQSPLNLVEAEAFFAEEARRYTKLIELWNPI